jgi:hypothetical protein
LGKEFKMVRLSLVAMLVLAMGLMITGCRVDVDDTTSIAAPR